MYFAWGETVGYGQDTSDGRSFDWSSYKWCNGSSNSITKYCTSSSYGTIDNNTILDAEDDAAHVNWGGSWRMPTMEEQEQLLSKCTSSWTAKNGVNGYEVTSKSNGNSIFIPTSGFRYNASIYIENNSGTLWSSSLNPARSDRAKELYFSKSGIDIGGDDRSFGFPIRAVCVLSE